MTEVLSHHGFAERKHIEALFYGASFSLRWIFLRREHGDMGVASKRWRGGRGSFWNIAKISQTSVVASKGTGRAVTVGSWYDSTSNEKGIEEGWKGSCNLSKLSWLESRRQVRTSA
uniref:Uncharacterized protein n=1 Tax=Opuntia streptacantha TaxID=393608 RepID=A0A7C8ZVC9_OPUST